MNYAAKLFSVFLLLGFAIPIMLSMHGMWWLFPLFFVFLRFDREQTARLQEISQEKKNLEEYERLEKLYHQE